MTRPLALLRTIFRWGEEHNIYEVYLRSLSRFAHYHYALSRSIMTISTEENNIDLTSEALLRTISCTDLQNEVPYALEDLFLAATEDGIFYLDFKNGGETNFSRSIKHMENLSRAIFDLPIEEKRLFDVDSMGKFKLNGFVLRIAQCLGHCWFIAH